MKQADQDIQDFFNEMRSADQAVEIPEFEPPQKNRKSNNIYWIPVGIAASLVAAFTVFNLSQQPSPAESSLEVIISVETSTEPSTRSLLESNSTIDAWTPATNSLIADF